MSQLVIFAFALLWLLFFYWMARGNRRKGLWIAVSVWLMALCWMLYQWFAADYDIARAASVALMFNHLIFGVFAVAGWMWGKFRSQRKLADDNGHGL